MKRLFSVLVLVLMFSAVIFAADYTVSLTTYTPTDSVLNFTLGAYPNIADGCIVDKIVLSNTGDVVQTVSVYDTCTSSTASSIALNIVIATTGTVQIDFPSNNPLKLRNLGAKKSATGSTVYFNVIYR